MATTIRCDIVSAEAEIFHGEAEMIVATGELGELGIAPKHAPLITRLKPGKVVVTLPGGEKLDFAISGGILEDAAGDGEVELFATRQGHDDLARLEARDERGVLRRDAELAKHPAGDEQFG